MDLDVHVQTRYLWLQERVAAARVSVRKVKGTQNPADILTKAASRETLERDRKMLGLRQVEAHSSQKGLRLESLDRKSNNQSVLACERTQPSVSADQSQLCDTCDIPADTSRTIIDEITGFWLRRKGQSRWNANGMSTGDESANVEGSDTIDNDPWIEVKAKSRTKKVFIQTSRVCRMNTTSSDSV